MVDNFLHPNVTPGAEELKEQSMTEGNFFWGGGGGVVNCTHQIDCSFQVFRGSYV